QYLTDAGATPMYDAFGPMSDNSPYTAIVPERSLTETNTASSANAAMSAQLPWNKLDAVPQAISDRILWQAVDGAGSRRPKPGPNASRAEHARAVAVMKSLMAGHGFPADLAVDSD